MAGELNWVPIDGLHRLVLDDLLEAYGLDCIDEGTKQQLNTAWHRLDP